MTDLITTRTLEECLTDALTARHDAGMMVEECWRRHNRSAHEDSEQRTFDYADARIADDVYREAQALVAALYRRRDEQRARPMVGAA